MDVLLGFTGGRCLEESVTYQAIVEEGVAKGIAQGRLEGARRVLLVLGEQQIGTPADLQTRARIEEIDSLEVLEGLIDRLLSIRHWEQLLANVPAPVPRRRRRDRHGPPTLASRREWGFCRRHSQTRAWERGQSKNDLLSPALAKTLCKEPRTK